MKLVKLLPAVAAAIVLSACSTASKAGDAMMNGMESAGTAVVDGAKAAGNAVANGAEKVKDTMIGKSTYTVAYTCSASGKKQPVTATYAFEGNDPQTATVKLSKKVLAKNLKVDSQYQDGVQFTDGKNVWNLSEKITPTNVSTVEPVMYFVKGKGTQGTDKIVAKDCAIVTK